MLRRKKSIEENQEETEDEPKFNTLGNQESPKKSLKEFCSTWLSKPDIDSYVDNVKEHVEVFIDG